MIKQLTTDNAHYHVLPSALTASDTEVQTCMCAVLAMHKRDPQSANLLPCGSACGLCHFPALLATFPNTGKKIFCHPPFNYVLTGMYADAALKGKG